MRDTNEILAKKTAALQPSGIRKFFDIVRTMEGVISPGVDELDLDTLWPTREEDIYSLERGRTFYTSNAGLNELHEEIARYIQRRLGISCEPLSEITATVGDSEDMDLACRAMLDPGDEVIVPQPSHVFYEPCVRLADGVPAIVELKEKDRFKLMPEDLEKATTPRTKFLVLPSPNNSTGLITTREELAVIMEVVIRHDFYAVSDEIYTKLTYNGEASALIIQIPGMQERTVLINGFSEVYVMIGWCLGYACGLGPMLCQIIKIHQYATMCASTTSQYAAVMMLRDCDAEIVRVREAYNQRRHYLLKRLEETNIPCFESEGASHILPDISKFGMSSEKLCMRLLTEEKVAVVPGTVFGQSRGGFVRIPYAYSFEQLREAMRRIRRFVERYAN